MTQPTRKDLGGGLSYLSHDQPHIPDTTFQSVIQVLCALYMLQEHRLERQQRESDVSLRELGEESESEGEWDSGEESDTE